MFIWQTRVGMSGAEGLHTRQNLRMIAAKWEFTSTLTVFETVAVVEQLTVTNA